MRFSSLQSGSLALTAVLSLLSVPALAFDTDADGVEDGSDAYPCDRSAAAAVFVPAQGEHSLLMFEDQWPEASDLDFNDLVLSYNYIFQLDDLGRVISLRATFNTLAIGGTLHNGLGLHLPVPREQVARISRAIGEGAATELTASPLDAELTVDLSSDLRELFGVADETINSQAGMPARSAPPLEIEIQFRAPVQLSLRDAPFDVFIFRSTDRSHEIHRSEYRGTAQMNAALFGQGSDGSGETRAFIDTDGLPSVLHVPFLAHYPREAIAISTLYPRITGFASSGGTTDRDWYVTAGDPAAAYQAPARPTPRFLGSDHVPADTGCIQGWGLAVEFGQRRNMFAYGSALDKFGHPVVTGYIASAIPNHTSAGGLDLFVAKYDAFTGAELWIRQFGGAGDETGRDVVIDDDDNIYLTGETRSALGGQPNAGGADAFVMKLDAGGRPLWTRTLGGDGNDTGYGIALDSQGQVVIGGGSSSAIIPGAPLAPENTPASFLARYTSDGVLQWVQHYRTDLSESDNYNYTLDVAVDPASDAIYAVGSERRYGEHGSAAENQFVARHSAVDGSIAWVRHIGDYGYRSSGADHRYAYAFGVTVDAYDGSIFMTGHWYGGVANHGWGDWLRAEGDTSGDATLVKLTSSGVIAWSYTLASEDGGDDFGEAVVADGLGGTAYFAGRTSGALPGKISQGGDDYFVGAYDHHGRQRWVVQDGTADNDVGHVAEAYVEGEDRGTVFVTGNTTGAFEGDDPSRWDIVLARHDLRTGGFRQKVVATRVAWRASTWGACSAQCGPGSKTRTVTCAYGDGTPADESLCTDPRPAETTDCTLRPTCSYAWSPSPWSACSATCGRGEHSRSVVCVSDGGETVADSFCTAPRPASTFACQSYDACSYTWRTGDWSQCSRSCGGGTHSRTVGCRRSDGAGVGDSYCDAATRPIYFEGCNTQSCTLDATSCSSMRASGVTASGRYTIYPAGPAGGARSVYCDMTSGGGGWTNLDFAANRVHLDGGHFIACRGGLSAAERSVTCQDPVFDGNAQQPLYHLFCDGSDRSANYLLEEVAPLLGHRDAQSLGFASLAQSNATGATSTDLLEYCYVAGQVVLWSDPLCGAYASSANGNCVPSFFTLTR